MSEVATGRHGGRVAVVTGAGQGLGQAFALRLAADGAAVAALDLQEPAQTAQLIADAGGRCLPVAADVTEPRQVAQAASRVLEHLGPCDILVNNAGISPIIAWDELELDDWRRVLAVNLDGQFIAAKAFVPQMRERGWGRIVNISSDTVGLAIGGYSHYMASKAGVIGFTRGLASDMGAFGVTVNAVCPGLTHTPTTDRMWQDHTLFADLAEQQAIKREAVPADIAGVVTFLASEDAGWVTGQTLMVDAGLVRL